MTEHPDNANLPVVNRPETVLGTTITFIVVAFIAICLRLYVRFRARLWGWDDLFVFLAGASTAVGSSITCLMPAAGMGRHYWTLSEQEVENYFKYIWATNVTYTSSTTLIKLAVLFQYLRLFDMQGSTPRRITVSMIVFIALWGSTFFFLALFSCNPIEKNWKFLVPGKCVAWGSKDPDALFASFTAHSTSNMVLDLSVLLLPVPFLRQLRAQGKTRIGLYALFFMGGIVAALAVARIIALAIRRAGTVPIFDPSYAAPAIYICSVLEVNIAILLASIPIFWPLVESFATNKILVVNEIEVHTSRRASMRDSESGFIDIGDNGGRASRMSITISGKNGRGAFTKPSTSASNKDIAIELGRRVSQESGRGLAPKHSVDSFGSGSRTGSIEHYQDRYVAEWVVPDFVKLDGHGMGPSRGPQSFTTKVERADMAHDQAKGFEK
ncbi:hypothetical protein EJ04DRAFT_179467 [Polyplosphaeria fusca]|uniref:Rhodopsin domain-containing protein n=1 Tax=Polyplosphaeria fusca TaxID=682080 RepID=A0A9P4V442_9PLEO|nr:hypothetical protein EJ04DRAFT_179467 [Polyplosphaeria fusca]